MEEKIIYQSKRKIVFRENDMLIKTYNDSYATSHVLIEALNQSKVSETGINAPLVYAFKKYNDRYGIFIDYIEGDNLKAFLAKKKNDVEKWTDLFAKTYHEMIQNKTLNHNNSYGRIKNKIFPSELPANIK